MNIIESKITKLVISGIKRIDPVTVITEDFGPGQGKIIIECYGKAWSSYWPAMGKETITEFFCSADEHYLAKNLSDIDATIFDADKINESAREAECCNGRDDPWNDWGLMAELYGNDPMEWSGHIPKIPNPDYRYLCRIILAVQQALAVKSRGSVPDDNDMTIGND